MYIEEKDWEIVKNKFILTITCDKNDADYITKKSEFDAVNSEYFNASMFVDVVRVIKKLTGGELEKTYQKLTADDIVTLYSFDTYGQDEDWVEKYVKPIGEYSIVDDVRDWDSMVADLFPTDTETCWGESRQFRIRGVIL